MNTPGAIEFYKIAKDYALNQGFDTEIFWQKTRKFGNFDETELLRESAWVILCSGFREATVRRCFPFISLCFYDWESASWIRDNSSLCKATASTRFRNEQKLNAIVRTAVHIDQVSFAAFKDQILHEPIKTLRQLPFIGEITAYHLAKNLGAPVAKPDRHLMRLADRMGFECPQELCTEISRATGDPITVVDLILWRYLEQGYLFSTEIV
jgi:hypothetical protein